jgi:phosphoglycerate-specific signal transduction histidine kinase
MKTHDQEQVELENLALAAELARQVCHDFSNFIHNLFLQIAIGETSAAAAARDWEGIKRESKRMARLLQEWDHFQSRFSFDETTIDLHQLIRQVAVEMSSRDRPVQLAPSISADPLCIGGASVATRHLLRLLVEEAFHTWEEAAGTVPAVSIQTENVNSNASVRILAQASPETAGAAPAWDTTCVEALQTSLLAATCRSLAVRLGATIQRERHEDRKYVIQIEFPLSLMHGSP